MSRYPVHRNGSLVAVLTVAIALLLSACGDDAATTSTAAESGGDATSGMNVGAEPAAPSDSDSPASTNLDPANAPDAIPDIVENDDPSAVQCTGQPKEVFDATAIVGESLDEASKAAEAAGCMLREVIKDGKPLAATQDFRPDRINVATVNGQVKKITGLG